MASITPVLMLLSLAVVLPPVSTSPATGTIPIKHVIIIVEENHTFDNYFGTYPGANGINGSFRLPLSPGGPRIQAPFRIPGVTTDHNPCHTWTCAHRAYASGKMDGFLFTDGGSNLTMGYFDYRQIPYYWDYASQFVLLDNFYSSVMADSLSNHLYLVAGQSGGLTFDARGGTVNFTSSEVSNSTFFFNSAVDELNAQGISWKYYAGGYQFLNNWNPMPAFESFKRNQSMLKNLADPSSFAPDVKAGKLANVVWMMPPTEFESEHAPYNVSLGEHLVVSAINTVMASSYWNSTAIFVTFDDYGGWYDHVPPPQLDEFGYGFRVPCLVISPYAKQGMIDHVQSDFTSLLKFVETVHSLQPLAARDSAASNMMEAFDFALAPRAPLVLPGRYVPDHYPLILQTGQTTTTSTSTASPTTTITHANLTTTRTTSTANPAATTTVTANPTGDSYVLALIFAGAFAMSSLVMLAIRRRPDRQKAQLLA
jgi:phospholipase C